MRYWSDESKQLLLTDAILATFGANSTGGCQPLLVFGANAPGPASERVAAKRTEDDSPAEQAARVAITQAAAHPRFVSRGFLDACAVLGDTPPVLAPQPYALDEALLPVFKVNEDGCIVLPDPSLLEPQRPIGGGMMLGMTLPVKACLIQYVEPRGGDVTVSATSEGSFPIEITGSCGFVPVGSGGAG